MFMEIQEKVSGRFESLIGGHKQSRWTEKIITKTDLLVNMNDRLGDETRAVI